MELLLTMIFGEYIGLLEIKISNLACVCGGGTYYTGDSYKWW